MRYRELKHLQTVSCTKSINQTFVTKVYTCQINRHTFGAQENQLLRIQHSQQSWIQCGTINAASNLFTNKPWGNRPILNGRTTKQTNSKCKNTPQRINESTKILQTILQNSNRMNFLSLVRSRDTIKLNPKITRKQSYVSKNCYLILFSKRSERRISRFSHSTDFLDGKIKSRGPLKLAQLGYSSKSTRRNIKSIFEEYKKRQEFQDIRTAKVKEVNKTPTPKRVSWLQKMYNYFIEKEETRKSASALPTYNSQNKEPYFDEKYNYLKKDKPQKRKSSNVDKYYFVDVDDEEKNNLLRKVRNVPKLQRTVLSKKMWTNVTKKNRPSSSGIAQKDHSVKVVESEDDKDERSMRNLSKYNRKLDRPQTGKQSLLNKKEKNLYNIIDTFYYMTESSKNDTLPRMQNTFKQYKPNKKNRTKQSLITKKIKSIPKTKPRKTPRMVFQSRCSTPHEHHFVGNIESESHEHQESNDLLTCSNIRKQKEKLTRPSTEDDSSVCESKETCFKSSSLQELNYNKQHKMGRKTSIPCVNKFWNTDLSYLETFCDSKQPSSFAEYKVQRSKVVASHEPSENNQLDEQAGSEIEATCCKPFKIAKDAHMHSHVPRPSRSFESVISNKVLNSKKPFSPHHLTSYKVEDSKNGVTIKDIEVDVNSSPSSVLLKVRIEIPVASLNLMKRRL